MKQKEEAIEKANLGGELLLRGEIVVNCSDCRQKVNNDALIMEKRRQNRDRHDGVIETWHSS
jgi:hypothetical protein